MLCRGGASSVCPSGPSGSPFFLLPCEKIFGAPFRATSRLPHHSKLGLIAFLRLVRALAIRFPYPLGFAQPPTLPYLKIQTPFEFPMSPNWVFPNFGLGSSGETKRLPTSVWELLLSKPPCPPLVLVGGGDGQLHRQPINIFRLWESLGLQRVAEVGS